MSDDRKDIQGFEIEEFKEARENSVESARNKTGMLEKLLANEEKKLRESRANEEKKLRESLAQESSPTIEPTKPSRSSTKAREKIIKHEYKSKDGFVTTSIKRGYLEIEYLFDLFVKHNLNCFICGGYVRYMASPHRDPYKAGDVDIYSYSKADHDKLFRLLKNNTVDGKNHIMTIKHENEVSVTFSHPEDMDHPLYVSPTIQLIKPLNQGAMVLQGDMETVLSNFDFTVVRCGLLDENDAMVDADFDYDEKKKMLRIKNIHCPVSSTVRCVKYGQKGYWMTPMQSLKLFIDWDNRDDDYRMNLIELVRKFDEHGVTKEELNDLEAMMRID